MPASAALPAPSPSPTLSSLLPAPLSLAEPNIAGPLVVVPIVTHHRSASTATPISFAAAAARGAVLRELPDGADVNLLRVENPLDVSVIFVAGEQVLGAKQDRVVNATVIVPARSALDLPVSCVEAGRWDSSRETEAFRSSLHVTSSGMRRRTGSMVRAARARGESYITDQRAVWRDVDTTTTTLDARTVTRTLTAVYERHAAQIAETVARVRPREGQLGAIVFAGGRLAVVDVAGSAELFAELLPRLARGWALDALGATGAAATDTRVHETVLRELLAARVSLARAPVGAGDELVIGGGEWLVGSGVTMDGRLVQASVFEEVG